MAIQISDKLLSEKAKKALNNSANKSQFLRDAIEFYVNSMDASNTDTFSVQGNLLKEVQELKKMINSLGTNKITIENDKNKEFSQNDFNNKVSKLKDIEKPVIPITEIPSVKKIDENKKEEENYEYDDIPECFR